MAVIRRILRTLVVLVLVVLAFAAGAIGVFTLTQKGRDNLAGVISRMASTADSKVTVSGISGIWSGNLRISRVVLEDTKGPWLAAQEIAVDWSPRKLLGFVFEAQRVAATRIEVARLPEPGKDEVPQDAPFSLPVDVIVQAIDLPDIALGQAVTGGQVAGVSATGKAVVAGEPLSVDADLSVMRSDGVAGSVLAAIAFAPSANRLEIDLKASEPSGGILANLLRLPGKPAVDIIVSGSGPAANWRGTGTFAVDGALIASVDARHRLTEAGSEVEARGDGDFASFVPDRFKHLLQGTTRFDIAGTATRSGGFLVKRADVFGSALTASAAGQFDPEGATDFSLEVTAGEGGLPLSFGTEESPIDITIRSATIRALGDGREPGLDIAADLPSVATNDVKLTGLGLTLHSDGFDLRQRIGPFKGGATARSLVIDNPTVDPLVAGEIRAGLEGTLEPDTLTVSSGTLRSDAIDGSFGGKVSLADGSITLDLKAGVQSAALPEAARPLLGEIVSLATNLQRDSEGNVSATALTVVSGGLSATGSAKLSGGQIDARVDGELADIAPAVPGGSGGVKLSATAKGSFVGPEVSATLTSDRIGFGGRAIDGLSVTVNGKADSASPDVVAAIKGSFEGQGLDAKATLVTSGGQKLLRDLDFALGANKITGTLSLDDAFLPDGTLRFDLPELGQLAALAGQAVQGAAQGTATFAKVDGVPQVDLNLTSSSIARDNLVATDVSIDALVKSYLGEPDITGKVGATIADLVAGQPPLTIDVDLDGSPAEITGRGALSMEGSPLTTFTATHRLTETGSVITAAGDALVDRFLPADLKSLVAGGASYDLAATIAKGGVISVDRATVSTAALSASASGKVGPADALDLTLDLAPGQAAAPLSLGGADSAVAIGIGQARLKASGTTARPTLDLAARLASVAAKGARLDDVAINVRADGFDPATRSGPVEGTARIASVTLDNATVAPLVAGEVSAAFSAALTPETITIHSGSITSDALNGQFDGSVSLADGAVAFNLRSNVASSALPAAARPVLGEIVQLAAAISRDAQGAIAARSISVTSGPLQATGAASLSGETLDAEIKGTLGDIAPLAGQAKGAIGFSATAKGALSAPDLDVTVSSDRLLVADHAIENLLFNATAKADLRNPAAKVTLKGIVGGEALDGRAVLATSDGSSAVRDLTLSLGRNRVAGALSLDPDFVPEGTIELTLPDIGPLAALALEKIDGSLNGRIVFERNQGAPRIAVKATSKSIVRGDLSVSDVAIDATVSNYLSAPGVAGTVSARQLKSGTTVVSGVNVDLARDGTWTKFAGGATVSGIPLKAAGRVEATGGVTTIELASAQAVVEGITTRLSRATTVRIVNGSTTLDRLTLALGSGTATISGTAGSSLDLNVALAGLPASLANRFAAGLDASGPISGTVKVSGAAANPTIGYQLDWTGARTSQTRSAGIGALTIRSSGSYAGSRLSFEATAAGGGLSFSGGGTVGTAGVPQLDLKFNGTVPLGILSAQLAAQGISVSGTAGIDVAVRGPAAAPAITGSVRASGARLVYVDAGLALNDITADISLGSDRATINRLTGTLSSGGTVSGSGTVGMASGSGFPADIAIRVADGRYTDGRVVTTTVSADLAIKGPLAIAPALTGTVNLARTVIAIPERLPASLTALDVKHKDAPEAVRRQAELLRPASGGGSTGGGMTLDVTVNAPQRIFVQGRGLDAELGGSLRLFGPVSSPQATGGFQLRRGRLSLLGRRLTFSEGSITFNGSLVPDLNFQASSQASDATVTVIVSGPASNPKFSFTSNPSLPEDEVLAQLIFGRAMSNLSAVQLAQLADAAAQLAGGGGSTSLLTSLREKLGVDNIDVTTGESGGAAVTVGKYLNDRTYLSIESGDKAGSSKASIDLDVGRGIKLRGSAADDGEAKGGIFFEREY
ncbi:MAG: translocation/assembly module TamB domain-containing protein [Rhizobiaceae bacterium]|nr:translocation/assembly module TamB domain-containing protein [Rhizobiaceae bacterium]